MFGGYWSDRRSKTAAYLAVGCIGHGLRVQRGGPGRLGQCTTGWQALRGEGDHAAAEEHAAADPRTLPRRIRRQRKSAAGAMDHSAGEHGRAATAFSGTFYTLAQFGKLASRSTITSTA